MTRKPERTRWPAAILAVFLATLAGTRTAAAGGFKNPPPGAAAGGAGAAFTARADDATAVTLNPAGLVQLQGSHLLAAPTLARPRVTHTDATGTTRTMVSRTHTLPNLYLAFPRGDSGQRLGLAITTPYGQSTEWPAGVPFTNQPHTPYFSEMKTIAVSPVFAWPATPTLSLGIGLTGLRSEITQRGRVSLLPPGIAGPPWRVNLNGEGWGGRLGLLFQPAPRHRLGLNWHSATRVRHRGRYRFAAPLPGAPATLLTEFPATAALGWAFQPTGSWTLAADLEWTGWSGLRDNPLFIGDAPPAYPYARWRNTISPRLGVEYRAGERWRHRVGYLRLPSPVPDAVFDPRLPEASADIITLGTAWHDERFTVGLSQFYSFPRTRRLAAGHPAAGTYRAFNHLVSVTIGYHF